MLLHDISAKKDLILALVQKYGAKHVRVFGSVARMEETEHSDIDLIVDFPKGYDMFGQRLPLMQALSDLMGRKIDLIPQHELNNHIRESVLKESIEI